LDKTVGGFQISANQYTQLRELMGRGPVRVHGRIDATLGPGQLTVVHAWIRGSKDPEAEVLISGHLDHPKWSANDNASGSAAMLEMVRTLHTLISSGKLAAPAWTIHFVWVPEYFGTVAYLTKHTEARACNPAGWDDPRPNPAGKAYRAGEPCIAMNLNLDMVGEDTVKTNSRFYITRTPDSAEGFLNGMMADVLQQTREAYLLAQAHAITGRRRWRPTRRAAITICFWGWASRRRCWGTIPTGRTTPAKTRSTRRTRRSLGGWEFWRRQRRIGWQATRLNRKNKCSVWDMSARLR
jgi:hypothetical protein